MGVSQKCCSAGIQHSPPGFVWAVLPRSGPKTNCSRKWYLPQGSTTQQRGCCSAGGSTCGACGIFMSPHRLVREAPGPILRIGSKKGLVVSKNTTQLGKCFQACLKEYLFHEAGARASGRRTHCSAPAGQPLLGHWGAPAVGS